MKWVKDFMLAKKKLSAKYLVEYDLHWTAQRRFTGQPTRYIHLLFRWEGLPTRNMTANILTIT